MVIISLSKRTTLLCVGIVLIALFYFLHIGNNQSNIFSGNSSIGKKANNAFNMLSKKWIVVTSINHPTEDVKRLAETGWNLVVVADKKTPPDWKLKGVHFISVEKQLQLGLKLPGQLPFGTYTRKNVGYLYAIMKGAEWIYDTDDDNKPYGLGLNQFDFEETVSGIRFQEINNSSLKHNVFNPYSYFGNTKMWPRGFPLEMLSNHSNGADRMVSCREMKSAAVQQGLVHKDPDVDAIYRVTDIWRSYFSQKLLHLIGETVAYYPVNAIQIRNAHNYLDDFEDERPVNFRFAQFPSF